MVELINEQPCAPIRHSHRASGRRDRAIVADGFEQTDLAMADCSSGPEIETQRKPRHHRSLIDADGARSPLRGWTVRFEVDIFLRIYRNSDRRACPSLRRITKMTMIRAKQLTTFSVAPDGSSVAIGVADEEGQAAALMLPAECLRALIMTLPDMMRRALRLQHGDPTLRLVYPVAGWEIERSTRPEIRIVTLRTSDGFHVSFAMTTKDLCEMSESVAERMLH